MKIYNLLLLIAVIAFIIVSCESDDNTINKVTDEVERGAILRTLNSTNTFNFFDSNDERFKFELSIEAQDQQNGDLLSEIRIYQKFDDNNDDSVDNSKEEVLVATIPKSDFDTGSFGLPNHSTSYSLNDALMFSELSSGQYKGGDSFVYRLVAALNDGREFSNDVGGTVSGGSFFNSPFTYRVGIKCIPVTPFPGAYVITMKDSYGDGWNNAKITVTLNGAMTEYTIEDGAEGIATINVPQGSTELKFEFEGGDFESEVTFTITDPFGDDAATGGPSPADGEIFLNICQ